MNISELQTIVRRFGVVGAGGAGFPAYKKLDGRTEILILNCAECEPLLKLHKQLLASHTDEILKSLKIIGDTVGAKRVILAVKESSKAVTDIVAEKINGNNLFELYLLPDVYPAGDEIVLTYEVTGRIVKPGELPISVGVTVFNVETVYNIYRALSGKPVTRKLVTVSGEVKKPVTVIVPLGTSAADVIKLAGGITTDRPAYIMGGLMMGRIVSEVSPVTKTTNGILVLPDDHPRVMSEKNDTVTDMKRAQAACCQCSFCTDMCPRNLLGHPVEPHKFMLHASNFSVSDTQAYVNSMYCSGCGLCELYACQQGLSPRKLMFALKSGLKEQGITALKFEGEPSLQPMREYRRVPMSRLKARLGILKYDKLHAPLDESEQIIDTVHIPLRQHVGAPSVPVVAVGDKTTEGQVIAQAPKDALSVDLHSSIDGKVISVSDTEIVIVRRKRA